MGRTPRASEQKPAQPRDSRTQRQRGAQQPPRRTTGDATQFVPTVTQPTQAVPTLAPPRPRVDDAPRPAAAPAHRRPARRFHIIAVFVLVVGAIAGVYLGVGGHNPFSFASEAPVTPGIDPSQAAAEKLALDKANAAAAAAAEKVKKANEIIKRGQDEASRNDVRTTYPAPKSCDEFTANRKLGCTLLLAAGFGLAQFPCLEKLWTKESGWNPKAENKSSGAYGIPQALPGDRMASFGSDWKTNPITQIKWGLDYIKNRYGTPCNAWGHSQESGWY